MLRAIGGHEIGPHVVVSAPNVYVINKGIGDLCGSDESQGTVLMTVEHFCEAAFAIGSAVVESTREAVVRHDISEIRIGQSLNVAYAV